MTKSRIAFIAAALSWYIIAGVFIAEREAFLHWFGTLAVYAYVAHGVFCWIFGLTMYSPYSGSALEPTKKNRTLRAAAFVIALGLMVATSIV